MIAEATERPRALPLAPQGGRALELTTDVACVPLGIVNAYLVGPAGAADRRWALVDAGLAGSAGAITRAAAERFGPRSRPGAIVLTHGHFDHVGALRRLAEQWDVPVYAHRLELPYITGESSYPPPDPSVGGGGMAASSFLYPRGPIDLGGRAQPLPEDGSVPGMPGWQWLHTPGHTHGHVSFFREAGRLLIAGDAFVTTKQESMRGALRKRQHVWRPPAYFTSDWDAARDSVRRLAVLEPELAATGHGWPMAGDELRAQLAELAGGFDRLARPKRGRYVRRPALADERGVVETPPRGAPSAAMIIGAGVLLGVGLGLLARRRAMQRAG